MIYTEKNLIERCNCMQGLPVPSFSFDQYDRVRDQIRDGKR